MSQYDRDTLVSVVIPNYNSIKTIKMCLDAVVNQTHPTMEILVVDDGSTDGSDTIIASYPCQSIKTQKNCGPSTVRNIGAHAAKGEIIFFLDSDVALFPDAVTNALNEFNLDPTLGSVCGIYDKVPLIRDNLIEDYRCLQAYYWRMSTEGIVTPGFFSLGAVKKRVFEEVGDFNITLRDSEDAEYGHRISKNYRLLLTSKVMGRHDDDDQLFIMMSKLFKRARTRVPLYFSRRKFMKGFETINRSLALAFALLTFLTLPLSLLTSWAALLPISSLVIFCGLDFGQYRFVAKEKGLVFLIYFTSVHLFVSAYAGLGVIKGMIDWVIDPSFRREAVMN